LDRSLNTFSSSNQDLAPDSLDRTKSLHLQQSNSKLEQVEGLAGLGTEIESLKHISNKYELHPSAKFSDSISSADESGDMSLEYPDSIDLEPESKLLPPVGALVSRPEHRYQGKTYPTVSGTITANFGISCELISSSGVGYRYRFELSDWLVSWFPAYSEK
jgi:hypothetical protein